jgi:hypothetical protein
VKRQLESAIRLYFCFGGPVSIHTLTAAAYNLARDLNTKIGGERLLAKERILDYTKAGHEKEVLGYVNKAENFFKHADRDHDSTYEFNPDQSEFLIFEACGVYFKITGEVPPLFKLYRIWFIANNQKLFNFSEEEKTTYSLSAPGVIEMGREKFFNTLLPVLSKIIT